MTRTALCVAILGLIFAPSAGAVDWLENGNAESEGLSSESAESESPGTWVNPNTGAVGTFTSTQPRVDANGSQCREYTLQATIAGEAQQIFGLACLGPDGRWNEASTTYQPPAPDRRQASRPPPAPTYQDLWGPYYRGYGGSAAWDWWYPYPSIGLSGSYCIDGFCIGGSTRYPGYGYPGYYRYPRYGYSSGWGYPYGLSFSFRGGGHRHYKHRGNHYKRHGRHYRHDRGHRRYADRRHRGGRHREHHRGNHRGGKRGGRRGGR